MGHGAKNLLHGAMHLSQLLSFVFPGLGLVMPIVMWLTNKDQFAEVDAHGKNIANWLITALIIAVVCFVLSFVFIGLIGFFALAVINLVFIILGAVKANDNILWPYPMSLTFIK